MVELASLDVGLRTDALNEIWRYAVGGSSKQTRSKVLLAAEAAARAGVGDPCAHADIAAAAVEMFHLATLPHDDVIDDSSVRRGVVSLPARYGAPLAAAAGCLFFGRALTLFARCGQDAVVIAVKAAERVCTGQMLELRDRYNTARTPASYLEAIEGKTAGMFRLAAELGAILGGADETVKHHLKQFGRTLGIGFQLIDDILDLTGNQEQMGKQCDSDLSNGNYTLPLIYALERSPKIGSLLREGAPIENVVNQILETDAIARASVDAQDWISQAKDAVRILPEARGLLMTADAEFERLSAYS
jgi:geranylgeranyl pyrophosphate synthase